MCVCKHELWGVMTVRVCWEELLDLTNSLDIYWALILGSLITGSHCNQSINGLLFSLDRGLDRCFGKLTFTIIATTFNSLSSNLSSSYISVGIYVAVVMGLALLCCWILFYFHYSLFHLNWDSLFRYLFLHYLAMWEIELCWLWNEFYSIAGLCFLVWNKD